MMPSEGGHWYDQYANPVFEVPYKNDPNRMKPTTLREARLLDLCPSVTNVQKMAAKPGLEHWKLQQLLLASLTLPREPGEDEDTFAKRVIEDSRTHAEEAAAFGTQVHTNLSRAINGELPQDDWDAETRAGMDAFNHVLDTLHLDPNGTTDGCFVSRKGFGGSLDWFGPDVVIDFKTTRFAPGDQQYKFSYWEQAVQLAAYRELVAECWPGSRACVNIYISTSHQENGIAHWDHRVWNEQEVADAWEEFEALLRVWQIRKKFKPSWTQ